MMKRSDVFYYLSSEMNRQDYRLKEGKLCINLFPIIGKRYSFSSSTWRYSLHLSFENVIFTFSFQNAVKFARGCEVYAVTDSDDNIIEAVDWNSAMQRQVILR